MLKKRYTALYLLVNDTFRRRFIIAEQCLDYTKLAINRGRNCVGFQYNEAKNFNEGHD